MSTQSESNLPLEVLENLRRIFPKGVIFFDLETTGLSPLFNEIVEFAGVKTLKLFGVTNEKKFSRPGFSQAIQIKDYGYKELNDFPISKYEEILYEFLAN